MPKAVSAPRDMVANKPAHGSPCNNCGLCCWSSKCEIGRRLFGTEDTFAPACPALRFEGVSSYCNVIRNPQQYTDHDPTEARAAAELLLYAGHGCTMRINGEMNSEFNNRLADFDRRNKHALDRAADVWGILHDDDYPF